ncbi:hypothetical protein B0H13DRAFT_2274408 [Mycena leptocephala]|nr:hypothetical protein B0H13DRAFT_2274408 [Mycena leptocephala]
MGGLEQQLPVPQWSASLTDSFAIMKQCPLLNSRNLLPPVLIYLDLLLLCQKRLGLDSFSGRKHLGPPHEDYGLLTLVEKASRPPSSIDDRPQAFASDVQGSGSTFHDFLPAHLITSPSSAESTLTPSPLSGESSSGSRFRDAVRRIALPSMQNVVNNVRRSTALLRKSRARDNEKEGRQLPLYSLRKAMKTMPRLPTIEPVFPEFKFGGSVPPV